LNKNLERTRGACEEYEVHNWCIAVRWWT